MSEHQISRLETWLLLMVLLFLCCIIIIIYGHLYVYKTSLRWIMPRRLQDRTDSNLNWPHCPKNPDPHRPGRLQTKVDKQTSELDIPDCRLDGNPGYNAGQPAVSVGWSDEHTNSVQSRLDKVTNETPTQRSQLWGFLQPDRRQGDYGTSCRGWVRCTYVLKFPPTAQLWILLTLSCSTCRKFFFLLDIVELVGRQIEYAFWCWQTNP